MEIASNTVVSIDYTLTNDSGEVLDQSEGRGPLTYLHGHRNLIPGLEEQLEGKEPGDELQVQIPPDKAYGQHDDQLVAPVPRERFPEDADVKPGMQFQAQTQQGSRVVRVVDVDDNNVTIDANHPLAGQNLNFDVKVVEVRDATDEEKSHGHVDGEGEEGGEGGEPQ